MKKMLFILAAVMMPLLFSACEKQSGTGLLKLSLTDSPIDGNNVSGVYITINSVQIHTTGGGWMNLENFAGPKEFNLLDLTRGDSTFLGSMQLEGGQYTQVRFMLDAPEMGMMKHSNPGCFIKFTDGSTEPLFVPSGAQTGFKCVGEFMVPVNGTVDITADFDVRKSVHMTGMGSSRYMLKPVIRLVVNDQAGSIRGNVTNLPADSSVVVYAYTAGTYKPEEANTPADSTASRFPNAISSDKVDALGVYHISYLAAGKYDLVVTTSKDGVFGKVAGVVPDITVESNKTTTRNIDFSLLK